MRAVKDISDIRAAIMASIAALYSLQLHKGTSESCRHVDKAGSCAAGRCGELLRVMLMESHDGLGGWFSAFCYIQLVLREMCCILFCVFVFSSISHCFLGRNMN